MDTQEEHRSTLRRGSADVFKQVFVMEKDSKRFPKTGGWGYAVSITMLHRANSRPILQASQTAECLPHGREVEGLHLPSLPETLNRTGVVIGALQSSCDFRGVMFDLETVLL